MGIPGTHGAPLRATTRMIARVGVIAFGVLAGMVCVVEDAWAHAGPAAEPVNTDGVADEMESEAIASQLGQQVAKHTARPEIEAVEISVVDAEYGYRATVRVFSSAGDEEEASVTCAPCGVTELAVEVSSMLSLAVDRTAAAMAASTDVAAPDDAGTEGVADPTGPETDHGEQVTSDRRGRTMKIAGVATASTGAVLAGVGIGLLIREDRVVTLDAGEVARSTTRPIGAATLGAGLGLVTTGAVLWIVGRRRPRATQDLARVQWHPRVDVHGGLGLGVIGSF